MSKYAHISAEDKELVNKECHAALAWLQEKIALQVTGWMRYCWPATACVLLLACYCRPACYCWPVFSNVCT